MSIRSLRGDLALKIAPVVLANITTQRPYHDAHVFRDGDGAFDPFATHPAFSNSYDWHSSVHSHWTALQLLAFSGGSRIAAGDRDALEAAVSRHLTSESIDAEARYLESRSNYERPYGWAWAMRLAAEAESVSPASLSALRRLASALAERAVAWLSVMPGPVRHGVHGNTAFALGLMRDAARTLGIDDLVHSVDASARAWFGSDRDYPAAWERSAHDFLSPGLTEADLMRRVVEREAFVRWWGGFIKDEPALQAIAQVADVPRVGDGQIVHLHGLNLSRASALARIAKTIGGAEADILLVYARELFDASASEASGDDYLSTHWLPTFAWDAASAIDAATA